MCLDKVLDNWRMDGQTFGRFLMHVSGFFKLQDDCESINLSHIKYAEIAADDLYVVSAIFGAYTPNERKMILAPIDPGTFILPWLNYFTLNLCEETMSGVISRKVVLESI